MVNSYHVSSYACIDQEMNPLVSVIIPTYNRIEFLQQCIDSILQQTYRPVEVIIADDGSTDGTKEFIRSRYEHKAVYIELPHSGLPSLARNAGIERSQGEYIAFCDSDDYWMPGKLELQLARLKKQRCNCSCADAYIIGHQEKTVLANHRFRFSSLEKNLLWDNFIVTSTVVLERQLLLHRQFIVSPSFPAFQDYILWLRLSQKLHIDFISQPLAYYRRSEHTISASVHGQEVWFQLRILFTRAAFYRHPFIFAMKLIRLVKDLLLAGT